MLRYVSGCCAATGREAPLVCRPRGRRGRLEPSACDSQTAREELTSYGEGMIPRQRAWMESFRRLQASGKKLKSASSDAKTIVNFLVSSSRQSTRRISPASMLLFAEPPHRHRDALTPSIAGSTRAAACWSSCRPISIYREPHSRCFRVSSPQPCQFPRVARFTSRARANDRPTSRLVDPAISTCNPT